MHLYFRSVPAMKPNGGISSIERLCRCQWQFPIVTRFCHRLMGGIVAAPSQLTFSLARTNLSVRPMHLELGCHILSSPPGGRYNPTFSTFSSVSAFGSSTLFGGFRFCFVFAQFSYKNLDDPFFNISFSILEARTDPNR